MTAQLISGATYELGNNTEVISSQNNDAIE